MGSRSAKSSEAGIPISLAAPVMLDYTLVSSKTTFCLYARSKNSPLTDTVSSIWWMLLVVLVLLNSCQSPDIHCRNVWTYEQLLTMSPRLGESIYLCHLFFQYQQTCRLCSHVRPDALHHNAVPALVPSDESVSFSETSTSSLDTMGYASVPGVYGISLE